MTAFRPMAFAAVLVLAALPAFAQADVQNAPPGMAGPGMMGPCGDGMTGGPGMMGMMGGPGMMDMMGGSGMMGMMGGPGMMGMMGGRGGEHVEGRLAFLKTELKITDAQAPQWTAFAEVVRANAKAMSGTHQSMRAARTTAMTLPDRLALAQAVASAHLDGVNRTTAALTKLYDVMSAEQKKIADEVVVGPMGMPMGMI
jgi:hypothetical protein